MAVSVEDCSRSLAEAIRASNEAEAVAAVASDSLALAISSALGIAGLRGRKENCCAAVELKTAELRAPRLGEKVSAACAGDKKAEETTAAHASADVPRTKKRKVIPLPYCRWTVNAASCLTRERFGGAIDIYTANSDPTARQVPLATLQSVAEALDLAPAEFVEPLLADAEVMGKLVHHRDSDFSNDFLAAGTDLHNGLTEDRDPVRK